MLQVILSLAGIACLVYGILVRLAASGTMFFTVWLCIGGMLILAALAAHFGLLAKMPAAGRRVSAAAIIAIVLICAIETYLIATGFSARGKPNLDYIIVLGAQVRDDGPSTVLEQRLDTAVGYLAANPKTRCIVTGGKGPGEPRTEAEAMQAYLLQKGVDGSRIIAEPHARDTKQNIANSKELMSSDDATVGIVTSNFHVFRGVALARKQGLAGACGIASPSPAPYLPNNVLREYFGITKDFLRGNL